MACALGVLIGVIVTGSVIGILSYRKISSETGKRKVAEEKNSNIPKLESVIAQKEERISELIVESTSLQTKLSAITTKLDEQKNAMEKELGLLNEAKEKFSDAFEALSAKALKSSNEEFLKLAKATLEKFQDGAKGDLENRQKAINELVKPLKESLEKVDTQIREIEKVRATTYTSLTEQIKSIATTEAKLQKETTNLVTALRRPQARGHWGEIQLRRVVEVAGMTRYCDFGEQESVTTEGGRLQPDMIVKLPRQRNIVVDSKVPLEAYLEAVEAEDDETRRRKLKEHARHVRTHLSNLSAKGYWEQFQPGPELVVLFLPGEMIWNAALEQDPSLIEFGVRKRVIVATPPTLIGLLRAVAYGWREQEIAENAQIISKLGKELYERVSTLSNHFKDIGKGLSNTVDAYNSAVGSFQSRVLVTARRFRELGAATGDQIEAPETIDKATRTADVGKVD